MTSLLLSSSSFRSKYACVLKNAGKLAVRHYTKMNRDISPPPAKRRKTSAQTTESNAKQTSQTAAPQPLPPLRMNSIRIFSWNVNGITPFLQKSIKSFFPASKPQIEEHSIPPPSLRGFLQRHKWPSILFLQEVKIASKDTKTQDAVKAAINAKLPSETDNPGPTYEAHFTFPNDPHNARGLRGSGKLYGVCSILRTDLHTTHDITTRTVPWDKEGRISIVQLTSKSAKLALFNIYAVNGTSNPYRDPATGAVTGTRHDRKLQFHRLLMQECRDLEAAGWDVLLAGDMNVAPDARDGFPKLRTFPKQHALNRADFHDKLLAGDGLNGVDVWREMHGEERRYTYYPRGREWGTSCDRVDFVVAGRGAWEEGMVEASGILDSEGERGPSDHCPVWVDVGLEGRDGDKVSQV